MGNFYVSLTVRDADPLKVASALKGRAALVTPAFGECVVAVDQACDEQDEDVIRGLTERLSRQLGCVVLTVLNHDDDVLLYWLCDHGEIVDEYDSAPGYFDAEAEPSSPAGGDAAQLCFLFGSQATDRVDEILQADNDEYVFAWERHSALASALGLPPYSVGLSFDYASRGDLPEGLSADQLIRVS